MGVKSFIPVLWSEMIFRQYDKSFVFGGLANREYEGIIRQKGDSVTVSEILSPTVKAYTGKGSVVYDDAESVGKTLQITEANYVAQYLDDVDNAQTSPKLMSEITRKMAVALTDSMDQFIAGLHGEAGITADLGSSASPIELNSSNVVQYMLLVGQKMTEENVPSQGRVAVVAPWVFTKLSLAKIDLVTDNVDTFTNGFRGRALGFDFYESNNVVHTSGTAYKNMFFVAGETIAMASQLVKVATDDPSDSFGEGVKALNVYGGKVMRPDSLAVLTANIAVEA